jgi:tRNA pseudouridine55 synthase/riboflavin kinase/FMN adenylyltransferase
MISGLILINKPRGIRSTHCVSTLHNILKNKIKVGHGGTLDSTADGLLVLLVGSATRLSNYVMMLPKEYSVTIQLGTITDTLDYGGEVLARNYFKHISEKDIDVLLPAFLGTRMQKPPVISALKLQGKRASDLKRSGLEPEMLPRPVTITSICRISSLNTEGQVSLYIKCHKGTYVRSIVRDIGTMLGCGASVLKLTRVKTGFMSLDQALPFDEMIKINEKNISETILPIQNFIKHFTLYDIAEPLEVELKNGKIIPLTELQCISRGMVFAQDAVCAAGKNLVSLGILRYRNNKAFFKPQTNLFLE